MTPATPLSGLYEAVSALGRIADLDALLEETLARARALLCCEHAALLAVDPDRGDLAVRAASGYGPLREQLLRHRLVLGHGLAGWAAQRKEPCRVGDVRADARYVQSHPDVRSNMAVPLVLHDELVGVVVAESHRVDAFADEHEKLLGILAFQAALALVGARSADRLRQRLAQLNALYRISRVASEREDIESVLDTMLEVTDELLPGGYTSILLLDPAARSLKVRARRGYLESVAQLEIPLGKGVTGRCAQTGQAVVVDDISNAAEYIPGVPGARSELAVPLLAEGRVIGVLNAESERPGAYGPDHVRTLTVIAQQAAVVLRAAQLYEETRRLAVTDALTGLKNRRHFVAQLEETLRRARRYHESFAVVLLDVDRFKAVNDRYGHAAGDRVLQGVAAVMRDFVRGTDELARIGGDEFAALLLQADPERALQVIERLREGVAALELRAGDEKICVTLSAGIALYPASGADAEALLSRADAALYEAKRQGRDRVVLARAAASAPASS
jgi:diguanylate cyclase (GGDEF)-like protein